MSKRSEERVPNSIGVNRNSAPLQAFEGVKLYEERVWQPGQGADGHDVFKFPVQQ